MTLCWKDVNRIHYGKGSIVLYHPSGYRFVTLTADEPDMESYRNYVKSKTDKYLKKRA